MTFSRFPRRAPRGGRQRDWVRALELPTGLELFAHGRVERGVAVCGFVVWDVGENRQVMAYGGVLGPPPGWKRVTPLAAEYQSLTAGLNWLVEHELHRRHGFAYSDSVLVVEQLSGQRPVEKDAEWDLLRPARKALSLCPNFKLALVSGERNVLAAEAATEAWVAFQQTERRERALAVLQELTQVSPTTFLVGDRYKVDLAAGTCSCPDFRRWQRENYPVRCKHLLAAELAAGKKGDGDA